MQQSIGFNAEFGTTTLEATPSEHLAGTKKGYVWKPHANALILRHQEVHIKTDIVSGNHTRPGQEFQHIPGNVCKSRRTQCIGGGYMVDPSRPKIAIWIDECLVFALNLTIGRNHDDSDFHDSIVAPR